MEGEQSVDLIRVQLRKQRALAGMNQEEFGKRTNYSASTVSAVETGTRPVDLPYARRADEILETGGLFESLLRTAQQDAQPAWFMPWLKAERAAKQLRYFNPTSSPACSRPRTMRARCCGLTTPVRSRKSSSRWRPGWSARRFCAASARRRSSR